MKACKHSLIAIARIRREVQRLRKSSRKVDARVAYSSVLALLDQMEAA